jgi:hypothetical protein
MVVVEEEAQAQLETLRLLLEVQELLIVAEAVALEVLIVCQTTAHQHVQQEALVVQEL